jgi:hypothetical protein
MMISHTRTRRISATAVAMFMNVAVLAVLSSLMAAGVERTLTARSISGQIRNLSDNLNLIVQARHDREQQLVAELDLAQSDLADAQAGTPTLGAPFQLYRRGFAMGPGENVEVQTIQSEGQEQRDSALGSLVLQTYSISISGGLADCVAYLIQLEAEGRPFLATDGIRLQADSRSCSFETTILGTDSSGRPASP